MVTAPVVEKKKVQLDFTSVKQVFAKPFQCTVPPNRVTDKIQWRNCWMKRVMVGLWLGLILIFLVLVIGIIIAMNVTSISYEVSGTMILWAIPIGASIIVLLIGTLISSLKEQYALTGLIINIILAIATVVLVFMLVQGL